MNTTWSLSLLHTCLHGGLRHLFLQIDLGMTWALRWLESVKLISWTPGTPDFYTKWNHNTGSLRVHPLLGFWCQVWSSPSSYFQPDCMIIINTGLWVKRTCSTLGTWSLEFLVNYKYSLIQSCQGTSEQTYMKALQCVWPQDKEREYGFV